jgi:rubrerythrin
MALFTASEAMEMAMEIERNGEAFYSAVAAQHPDGEIKLLFEDLALQEQAHFRLFRKMRDEVQPSVQPFPYEADEYKAYLQVALDGALFYGADKALAAVDEAQDPETAIRVAMGFEKDTLLFFYDVREMVSDKDWDAISRVILEEKRHVRRLAKKL